MNIALVTGASGNLGQAIIKKFLAEGFYVIGTIVPNDPVGISIQGKNFETAIVDLMNEDAAQQFVELIAIKHGRIDVAILTVGGFTTGSISETRTSDITRQYKLNFETTYNVARPVFNQMMRQKAGRIFMVGSRAGSSMMNSKGTTAYGLSKSLIFRLAELMNEEAKGQSVVTSVIVPSLIDTPQNRQSMPDTDFSKWVKPETIAGIILFPLHGGGGRLA